MLSVFPGSEPLRYMIPFRPPQETIDYLGAVAERASRRGVRVWRRRREVRHLARTPSTRLRRRLADAVLRPAVRAIGTGSKSVTPSEALDNDAAARQDLSARGQLSRDDRVGAADRAAGRVRAGAARDGARPALAAHRALRPRRFLAQFPRQVSRSQRNVLADDDGQPPAASRRRAGPASATLVEQARTALYRGQCNCAYWHGAFGGVYLPHLRNAIYRPSDRGRQPARRRGPASPPLGWK